MTAEVRSVTTDIPSKFMDITVANSRHCQTDFNLSFLWRIQIHFFDHQGFAEFVANRSFHKSSLSKQLLIDTFLSVPGAPSDQYLACGGGHVIPRNCQNAGTWGRVLPPALLMDGNR